MNNILDALIAAKLAGGGGGGGEVTPASIVTATGQMTDEQKAATRANIGATDAATSIPDNVKQALLACFDGVAWEATDRDARIAALEAALYPLDHITAAYTQSGTVYDSDSIDSLKSDLVVTAYYESGNTATVEAANYTLSGTLTPGTSTITVSYGGKTTSFTVTATAGVPSEYQKCEWIGIESRTPDGNAHYIDTGITPTLTSGIEIRLAATGTLSGNLFGIRQSQTSADNAFLFQCYMQDQKFGFARFGSTVKTAAYDNNFHDFVVTADECSVDGTDYELAAPTAGQSISGLTLRLFGVYAALSGTLKWFDGGLHRVAACKLLDGSTVVRDFVPCYKKADSTIGMWDYATQAFFPCVGTFVKGSDV